MQVLIGNQVPFDLPIALTQAAPLQPIPITEDQIQQVVDFVLRRLEQVLVDGGISVEAVRAVLRQRGNSPALAAESAQQLQVGLSTVSALPSCPPVLPFLLPGTALPVPYLHLFSSQIQKLGSRSFT